MSMINGLCDIHWIFTVLAAYIFHVYKCNTIGIMVDYTVDAPNTLFVMAIAMLIAEYRLWPLSLKRPSIILLLTYEVFVSALLTNIARTLIWTPASICLRNYLPSISKKIIQLNSKLRFEKYGLLFKFSRWLESECGLAAVSRLMAILVFIWVLHATDTMDHVKQIKKMIEQKIRSRRSKEAICRTAQNFPSSTSVSIVRFISDIQDVMYTVLTNIRDPFTPVFNEGLTYNDTNISGENAGFESEGSSDACF